jgi:hypothetical protein
VPFSAGTTYHVFFFDFVACSLRELALSLSVHLDDLIAMVGAGCDPIARMHIYMHNMGISEKNIALSARIHPPSYPGHVFI